MQSQDRIPEYTGKLISCLIMETYTTLSIPFWKWLKTAIPLAYIMHYILYNFSYYQDIFIAFDIRKNAQIKLYIWWYIYLFFFITVYSFSCRPKADQILPNCPHHIIAEQACFMCTTPVGMTNRTFWTWSRWFTVRKLQLRTKQSSVTDMFRKKLFAQRY